MPMSVLLSYYRSLNLRRLRHQCGDIVLHTASEEGGILMSKKSFYPALLVVAALAIVLFAAEGCSRPKPEAKETPVAEETTEPVAATQTPESAPTQVSVEPTVVTLP